MDTDTAGVILKLFSSLGFILLGAAVSRIAAFISGIDIFRDLSAEHARLIALTAGIIIFILSPLGSLAVLFLFVSCPHGRALRRLFDRLCRDIASEPGREARFRTLERLLDELYYYLDLNRETGRGGYERLTEQLLRRGDYGEGPAAPARGAAHRPAA